MKIKLSKSQWETIGSKAGWIKQAIALDVSPFDKELVAEWKSSGGKYFVRLFKDEYGYAYKMENGCGNIGNVSLEEAIAKCEQQASYCPSKLARIK